MVNSGCANAVTGEEGMRAAIETSELVSTLVNCRPEEVLVCSTGVIGVQLDMEKLGKGLRKAAGQLSAEGGNGIARAIMTTDTFPKQASTSVMIGGKRVTVAGVAKGAGMIHPDMATLLSFVFTDLDISKSLLQKALSHVTKRTFNRLTVDGDTSTNDSLILLSSGSAGNKRVSAAGSDFDRFIEALEKVCRELAILVARDGEGARKLITIKVTGASSEKVAEKIAATVATSPLVKTAIAGEDANWGRILAAAGRAGVVFDVSRVDIKLGKLFVARKGRGLKFDEARALEILKHDSVEITIALNDGEFEVTEWTCDLTEGYIKINADYRT